jgi:hypothetical protein
MKKFQILFFFLLFSKLCFGQEYLLPNEEVVFSFETPKGKKMVLAKDKDNEYLVYRFGTEKKIELEYPQEKNKESWGKFTYYYYHRPGGPENDAMYLTNVSFRNEGYEYAIYSEMYMLPERDDYSTGILITNAKTDKRTNIEGIYESVEGKLEVFAENNLLKFKEEYR